MRSTAMSFGLSAYTWLTVPDQLRLCVQSTAQLACCLSMAVSVHLTVYLTSCVFINLSVAPSLRNLT